VAAFVVAASFGILVAFFEQASVFGVHRLHFRGRALGWWILRLALDAVAACVILVLGRAGGVAGAHQWWGGLVAALVSTQVLRSSILELPNDAYGARKLFDRWRRFVTGRLTTMAALGTTALILDDVLPTLLAAGVDLDVVAARLRTFIQNHQAIDDVQKAAELEWIAETVQDDATDSDERISALIQKAFEVGGEDLIEQIRDSAIQNAPESPLSDATQNQPDGQ
jgi:hypothetical protein